ncbi:hypothetical protein HAX54_018989 [Datura stramonium]|uniref:Uncharacterized protein n=1 Tax=Datura stramonium TaxID=4076 RepID=A0ABS8UR53_DATST|nr:hypothetical protein [Datura stramonium]
MHQQPVELGRVQRLASWSDSRDTASGGGGAVTGPGGYLFNSPPAPALLQQLFGQNRFFQRGPLQSSNTPFGSSMDGPISYSTASADPSGFSGFRIPARIQGEEEEHDGISMLHLLLPLILVIELAPQILSFSVPDRDMLYLNAIGTYRSNAVRAWSWRIRESSLQSLDSTHAPCPKES